MLALRECDILNTRLPLLDVSLSKPNCNAGSKIVVCGGINAGVLSQTEPQIVPGSARGQLSCRFLGSESNRQPEYVGNASLMH